MPLWTFPAVVTGPVVGPHLSADLDLGCRLTQPTRIRVAGINPRRSGPAETALAGLLPEGTQVLAVAERITTGELRAHLVLPDGVDVVSAVRHRSDLPLQAEYGGTLDKRWRYPAVVVRVHDGDTVQVRVDLGTTPYLRINVRVAHVNAPENDTAEGQAATVWAEQQLPPGTEVTVTSHSLDKYGRLLATVTTPAGDYGQAILAAGHAVPYEGGPRTAPGVR